MAGIGFELRRLSHSDTLFGPVASLGHGVVIAAGPWLMTIAALVVVGTEMTAVVGEQVIADMRILIVYAFATALIATSTIAIVSVRQAADAMYLGDFDRVRELFIAALFLGAITSSIAAAAFFCGALRLAWPHAVAASHLAIAAGTSWIALAVCGSVKDFRGITLGFSAGFAVATALAVLTAQLGFGSPGMVGGFAIGLLVASFILAVRILALFPRHATTLRAGVIRILMGHRVFGVLAAAAFVAAISVWVDKWIVWAGPFGQRTASGLPHAPIYDAPMFFAYFMIVPALAQLSTALETLLFERLRHFYAAITAHATLAEIRTNARRLERDVMTMLTAIMLQLSALCAIVVLSAPMIVTALSMQYQQLAILRIGAVAAVFHFLFMACSALLLYFERHAQYFALQALFVFLAAACAQVTVIAGVTYYGLGQLVAAIVASGAAYFTLGRTLDDLPYQIFVAGPARVANRYDPESPRSEAWR